MATVVPPGCAFCLYVCLYCIGDFHLTRSKLEYFSHILKKKNTKPCGKLGIHSVFCKTQFIPALKQTKTILILKFLRNWLVTLTKIYFFTFYSLYRFYFQRENNFDTLNTFRDSLYLSHTKGKNAVYIFKIGLININVNLPISVLQILV